MLECLSVGVLVVDHLCAPIDHLPKAGELVLTDQLLLTIGGCAANAATDMARLGIKVGAVGCVGEDTFGRFLVDALTGQGVDTTYIRRLPDVGTSGTLIINVRGEDRRFVHTMGANARLTACHIPVERFADCKILYVGGYLLAPGLAAEELATVFKKAKASGVRTVLDVVLPGPGDHKKSLAPLLPETDVFLPNSDEAAAITGLDDPCQQAQRFVEAGAQTVVITCGGEGTVLASDGLRLRAGAYRVPFVGGTGAGDAFDAGYIAGMIQGMSPGECLRWGSAMGASCVRSIGATDSVFTRDEVEAYLAANPLPMSRW